MHALKVPVFHRHRMWVEQRGPLANVTWFIYQRVNKCKWMLRFCMYLFTLRCTHLHSSLIFSSWYMCVWIAVSAQVHTFVNLISLFFFLPVAHLWPIWEWKKKENRLLVLCHKRRLDSYPVRLHFLMTCQGRMSQKKNARIHPSMRRFCAALRVFVCLCMCCEL